MSLNNEQQEQVKKQYYNSIDQVEQEDVDYAYKKGQKKVESLKDAIPGKLADLWDDIKTMLSMLGDYLSGKYRDVPWKTIAAIAGAIIYFVSPIDFIPDFIPVIGYVDDAMVVALAVDLVRDDLAEYREWQKG